MNSSNLSVGLIKKSLSSLADTVGKKRDGSFIIRRGFYYRHGADAESYKIAVCKKLMGAGVGFHIKDYGEHFTTFRGGATIANQSHWFVEIWPE